MAASNSQPFEISDFSGGMTDNVYDQANARGGEEYVNVLIGSDKKPISRFGSRIEVAANPDLPSGDRVGALVNYSNSDKLFYQSARNIYYRDPTAFTELLGPTSNHLFSEGTPDYTPSFAQWNRHLFATTDEYVNPMVIFKDDGGDYQLRTAGLPALATAPTVTAGSAGANSYIYSFYYSVEYTVFSLEYETIGPVTSVSVASAEAPNIDAIEITAIPVLDNGLTNNYDVTNVKIQIYRTANGGTFQQRVGEVTNGTTTFSDSMSDTTLEDTGIPLYTNDGTVDFDPPPLHKFNHIVNNTQYYGYIKDGANISPYKIRQSIPGVPGTGPIDFEIDVDDELEGISSVNHMPIAACKKFIYRLDGAYDQFGRGAVDPVRISDHAGCISHNSMVQAEGGLAWLGNDGVYFTDGYVVRKVSDHLNVRYKAILANTTQRNRVVGKYYEASRLIIWTIQTDSSNEEHDSFLILDLKPGISDEMTFLLWNGNSFRPSALEIFNGEIYRGDQHGYVYRHQTSLYDDHKKDVSLAATAWTVETIIWRYRSIHYNFGSTFFRKYPSRILVTAADAGNTTIQVSAVNDDGRVTRNCKPIRIRRDFIWDDDEFVWRVSDFIWRGSGLIEQWRRFPAGGLRLSTMQIVITNGFSDITNSDTLGPVTFSGLTATLSTVDMSWPDDVEDYYLAIEEDGYVTEYLILTRDSDTEITVSAPTGTFAGGGEVNWVIRGYKKGEPLHLLSYNIHWTNVSKSQATYDSSAASTGENA